MIKQMQKNVSNCPMSDCIPSIRFINSEKRHTIVIF